MACRTNAAWRESLRRAGLVAAADFDCPHGVTRRTASTVERDAKIKLARTAGDLKTIARSDRQGPGTCCGQAE